MKKVSKIKGFTLIEILVVIGIIAVLAAIVIIAINPARQFAQARNSQRVSNLNTLLNGLGQNLADNKGVTTCTGIGVATTSIGTPASATVTDLSACLVPTYIPSSIPMDPKFGTAADTGYEISLDAAGRYTLCVKHANEELGTGICVTR